MKVIIITCESDYDQIRAEAIEVLLKIFSLYRNLLAANGLGD